MAAPALQAHRPQVGQHRRRERDRLRRRPLRLQGEATSSTPCSGRSGWSCCCSSTTPWRVFLTTDHPNGAGFWRYPEIIQLLMDADFRQEQLKKPPAEGAEADRPAGSGPRVHALRDRHHHLGGSGAGARADAEGPPRRRAPTPTWRSINESTRTWRMFAYPRYVIKGGEVVIEEGEIRKVVEGKGVLVQPGLRRADRGLHPPAVPAVLHDVVRQLSRWRWSGSSTRTSALQQPTPHEHDHADAEGAAARPAGGREPLARRDGVARSRRDPRPAGAPGKAAASRSTTSSTSRGRPATSSRSAATCRKVKWIGRGMTRGRIAIVGDAGMHLGAYMKGGTHRGDRERVGLAGRRDDGRA